MIDSTRDDVKNQVKEAADIVAVIGEVVELKRAGSRFVGLCPFHAEKTPSFSVNPQGQFYHCFGCGESGDVFSFVMKYHRLEFPEALKDLARRYQIDLPERQLSDGDRQRIREREQLYRCNELALHIYRECLLRSPLAEGARDYLARRGVSDGLAANYRLGYAPDPERGGWDFLIKRLADQKIPPAVMERAGLAVRRDNGGYYDRFRDRVLFPILDLSGRCVAFGGRILGEGKPKYLNSPESPVFDKSHLLFGLQQHREAIRARRRAVVVEGNFDLLLLAGHGITHVVAPLGTSLTRFHIRSLRGYCDEVVLLFDGDSAGLKAAMRSIPYFLAEQLEARIALLPQGHDPDSLVREQGAGAVEALLEGASGLAEFTFATLTERHGLTLDGKARIIGELQEILRAATDAGQQALLASHFAQKLGVPPAQLSATSQVRTLPTRPTGGGQEGDSISKLPRKQRQLFDFLFLYPESLPVLQEAGLLEMELAPAVALLAARITELSGHKDVQPEDLLACVPLGQDRNYAAELLLHGPLLETEKAVDSMDALCAELIHWIRSRQRQVSLANLQEKINAAQAQGNHALLMQLLREKQQMAKK